ncbi:predicted protein [Streptomyces viridosporus ATCC 14672]|uniref:Predicted protein n=1 Tax=Streptomyces viridosporus (strain ATCC 14672 / DSM 40746 / JCM 4963 / KCTC 9882 / NRRL B-12104 / FH 1290) TaxID=566461 RepID=D5ZQN3_STRV1|nr:predicted protein [Streptomyces viridosporus ATCC 14672]
MPGRCVVRHAFGSTQDRPVLRQVPHGVRRPRGPGGRAGRHGRAGYFRGAPRRALRNGPQSAVTAPSGPTAVPVRRADRPSPPRHPHARSAGPKPERRAPAGGAAGARTPIC